MNGLPLLVLLGHVLLASGLLLGFFHLRRRFGLTLLCALLAVLQPVQVVLSAGFYVEVLPGVSLSLASVAWYPAGIMAVLLVYLREDALAVRRVIYSLLFANVAVAILFEVLAWQVPLLDGAAPLAAVLDQSARVTVAGATMLLVDVLLVMPLYEALGRLAVPGVVRIWVALAGVLLLDAIGFALLGFLGTPLFAGVLLHGGLAKVLVALPMAVFAALYLSRVEPLQRGPEPGRRPLTDVFDAFSYRQRFELQQAVTEDALATAADLHRQLLDATTDGVLALDGSGRVVDANAEALRLLGEERAALVGTRVQDWVQAAGLDEALAASPVKVDRDQAPLREHLDAVLAREADRHRHLELWVTPLLPGSGPVRAMLAIRDVSDRHHHFQQQLHASRMDSIGRLAGGVAHDFNNLLTVIMSGATLLEYGGSGGEEVKRQARLVREAAERGSRLTSQLLSFARKEMLPPQVVDANEVIAALGPLLERLLGDNHQVQVEAGEIWPVWISPDQLEQVVLNLATNARDAMPEGGTVVVRTGRRTLDARSRGLAPGDYCVVEVVDAGVGIAAADLPRIFDPFFTTKAVDEGTGLGLSMCLGITEQAGGGLLVDSAPDTGTRMRVLLPRTQRERAAAQGPGQTGQAGQATVPARVLVVDDDASVAEVVKLILQAAGHRVDVRLGAEAALHYFEAEGRPDLLVTDIVMPDLRGDQLVRELAARGFQPPVVFLTGHAAGVALDVDGLGGHPLLHKPFRAADLLATVERVLEAESRGVAAGG